MGQLSSSFNKKIEEMDIMRCCMTWTKNILQAYSGENSTFFSKFIFQGPIYL